MTNSTKLSCHFLAALFHLKGVEKFEHAPALFSIFIWALKDIMPYFKTREAYMIISALGSNALNL